MNKHRKNLLIAKQLCSILLLAVFIAASALAQNPTTAAKDKRSDASREVANSAEDQLFHLLAQARPAKRAGFSLMAPNRHANTNANSLHMTAAASPAVLGNGTVGKISLWVDTSPSGNSILGDSIITQLNGNIGIGLTTPTSKLTVQGMIETTLGGYKFPDGTIQTTSAAGALFGVAHDATLQGNGTGASPLGVAVPLSLSGSSVAAIFSATNSGFGNGVRGTSTNGAGVNGIGVVGVLGTSTSTSTSATGVFGESNNGTGVDGSGGSTGVRGKGETGVVGLGNTRDIGGLGSIGGLGVAGIGGSASSLGGDGVFARGGDGGLAGYGVLARGGNSSNDGGIGVRADGGAGGVGKTGGTGVLALGAGGGNFGGGDGVFAKGGGGSNLGGAGVIAEGGNSSADNGGLGVNAFGGGGSGGGKTGGDGIFAQRGTGSNGATNGRAGNFVGDVIVQGNFSATGTKMFKIDHPLDPENKYLNHAAIESSEVLNVYSGNITTDQNGDAVVQLPDWFEAVNKDFRYQLTVIGTFAQAIVTSKMKDNRFAIKTNAPNVEVSWQVTGVRSDAVMKKYPFKAEEEKAEGERGYYLTPEVFNQPEEKSIEWARHPEMMQKLKQQRLEAEEKSKKPQQR